MGIARAIERVKRQAKQGGLSAVMAGLGEELRNRQLPRPLRGTAERIATLLEGGARATPSNEHSGEPSNGRGDVGIVGAASNTNAIPQPIEVARATAMGVGSPPRAPGSASSTGSDSGAEPGPVEPASSTPVDPLAVGATPEVIASPVQVEPVDASPVEVEVVDATPIEVEPAEIEGAVIEPAHTGPTKLSAPETGAPKGGARHGKKPSIDGASANDGNSKQDLAQRGEEAKNLARSGSRGAKKRSGSRGNASKKK